MAEQSKKITIYIFLFALFMMLAFFIAVNIYNIYMDSKTSSIKTTKGALECAFSFSVSDVRYDVTDLSFSLRSSNADTFKKMIIDVAGEKTDVPLGEFFDFNQKVTVKDMVIPDKFRIYPEGCEEYNIKECSVKDRTCIKIK
jgi:hypothetical protein